MWHLSQWFLCVSLANLSLPSFKGIPLASVDNVLVHKFRSCFIARPMTSDHGKIPQTAPSISFPGEKKNKANFPSKHVEQILWPCRLRQCEIPASLPWPTLKDCLYFMMVLLIKTRKKRMSLTLRLLCIVSRGPFQLWMQQPCHRAHPDYNSTVHASTHWQRKQVHSEDRSCYRNPVTWYRNIQSRSILECLKGKPRVQIYGTQW